MNGKRLWLLTIACLLLVGSACLLADATSRDEIADRYKWDLNDIYPSWEAWEGGLQDLEAKMDEFAALKGTLKDGPQQLLHAMQLYDELDMLSYKVYRYPQLAYDLDTRQNENAGRMQQVIILFSKFGTATSWLSPEQLEIGWDTLEKWFAQEPALQPYYYGLHDLYRRQTHILDEKGEQLISYFSGFNNTPSDIYTQVSTADIEFPTIELSTGDSVTLSWARYGKLLTTNRNQADRRKAWQASYGLFFENTNTYAGIYNAVCQRDWASAQARNFHSTLEAALDGDNVPPEVYENLVNVVKAGSDPLQRYYRLRKQVLGLEEYHLYDGAISIVDWDKQYDYDAIQQMIVESLTPFGSEYQDQVNAAFNGRWLDVYETEGKTSGAYSAGVYGVHPYMLLNYNGTLESVFTVAHELGHTMHSQLASATQPFATSHPTIFVAEVASTLNEALFLDYMLAKTENPKERIALLAHAIENIDGTFYTQVMFSDFEMRAHRLVEEGQPITADVLNGLQRDILTEYYGDAIDLDDLYGVMWSRIPHFFETPFYVYKYATCFASSAKLHQEITSGDPVLARDAVQRHLQLLKSGGNDYPMELLKKAGVDLTKPEVMQAVVDQLDTLVTQLESELAKL
ncbi:MAG: oligoendopeptidase F [bacterium]